MPYTFKFINIALALMLPVSALAVDLPSGVEAGSTNLLPPKSANTRQPVVDSEFIPDSREYDWHAASAVKSSTAPVAAAKKEIDFRWVLLSGIGVVGGIGSYWLGRRRRDTGISGEDQFSERRRVIATKQVFVTIPNMPKVTARKTSALPVDPVPAGGGSFDLFLNRANLLTGKNSGPDMGRW